MAVVAVVAVAAGCGSSSGSGTSAPPTTATTQANATICTAIDGVKKQVSKLQGVTNGSVSLADAATAVSALQADLVTLKNQASKMGGSVKSDLQSANAAFTSQVNAIASSVMSSSPGSLSTALSKLSDAAGKLSDAYSKALSGLRC